MAPYASHKEELIDDDSGGFLLENPPGGTTKHTATGTLTVDDVYLVSDSDSEVWSGSPSISSMSFIDTFLEFNPCTVVVERLASCPKFSPEFVPTYASRSDFSPSNSNIPPLRYVICEGRTCTEFSCDRVVETKNLTMRIISDIHSRHISQQGEESSIDGAIDGKTQKAYNLVMDELLTRFDRFGAQAIYTGESVPKHLNELVVECVDVEDTRKRMGSGRKSFDRIRRAIKSNLSFAVPRTELEEMEKQTGPVQGMQKNDSKIKKHPSVIQRAKNAISKNKRSRSIEDGISLEEYTTRVRSVAVIWNRSFDSKMFRTKGQRY